MRIGLISDTHVPSSMRVLWPEIRTAFLGVDLILHAGDIYDLSCLDWLEEIAPVMVARGNGDAYTPEDPRIKDVQIIEVESRKIGMVHGLYYPGPSLEKEMRRNFGGPVDIIIFGDTHVETIERHDGVLLVNPGSPTYPHNYETRLGTVGILELTPSEVEARIINLKEL
ncbi:MAG: metallophosphoesterase family protein [Dehalococcoidia bacterium]|nr:metallophosphoesterase family protein [Dehalococcoidia bacterium]